MGLQYFMLHSRNFITENIGKISFFPCRFSSSRILNFISANTKKSYVMRSAIWYHLQNLKNVKNTHGRVLLLLKLQVKAYNFIKSGHGHFSRILNRKNLATHLIEELFKAQTIVLNSVQLGQNWGLMSKIGQNWGLMSRIGAFYVQVNLALAEQLNMLSQ